MQMVESTESLSDYNKSSSSGGWYHRSRGAGWLSLLTGARWLRGGSRAPQTKGTLAPCTPGTATMGNIKGRLEPRQPKSWGGARGDQWEPRAGGSLSSGPSGTLRLLSPLLRVLIPSLDTSDAHPPLRELGARLVFQGFGQRQKGPTLRMKTPPDGDGGKGESQLSPRGGGEAPPR